MILLLDFEATSKDPKTARTLEIGAMLTDYEFSPEPDAPYSTLVWDSGYPPLTEEVAAITGITMPELLRSSLTPGAAFAGLRDMAEHVTMVVAYNRGYDETLYRAEMARLGMDAGLGSVPWVCAMRDIPTNPPVPKKLMYLALDYGVTVDPKCLHRAINDVELMAAMLVASGTTPDAMLAYQREPSVVLKAKVSYDNREEAKKLGYSWERVFAGDEEKTYPKSWVKRVKQSAVQKELDVATFPTDIID